MSKPLKFKRDPNRPGVYTATVHSHPWWRRWPNWVSRAQLARHSYRLIIENVPALTPAESRLIWRTLLLGGNIHINTTGLPRVSITANGEPVHEAAGYLPTDCGFIDVVWPTPGGSTNYTG